jgi:hypothetical protein
VFLDEIDRRRPAVFQHPEILLAQREDRLVVAPGHDDVHGHGERIGLEHRNASLRVGSGLGAERRHTAGDQSKREKA